jgi:CheY-like chemotaxis protein
MKQKLGELTLRIVLADDDKDDREFFKEAIEAVKVHHSFRCFEDGEKLMSYLSNCGPDYPHLIFLDLNMPRKSGIECLREIRADKKYKDIVIVIYSTSSAKGDIDATFLAGANIYITKPDSLKKLKQFVEEAIIFDWQYHTSQLKRENFVMVR